MKTEFDSSWKAWIHHNIARGCDKDGIFQILLNHDFAPDVIAKEMQHKPSNTSIEPIEPPTKPSYFQELDNLIIPNAKRINTDKATLYLVDDFLSSQDCDALISTIRHSCRPSDITTAAHEKDKSFRTSQTCDLCLTLDASIQDLARRLSDYLSQEPERAEGIQGQYYQVGQEFKPHTDYFEPNTSEYQQHASQQGQRTWTFMIYLNDVTEGGETIFPHLDIAIKPKRGLAVIWNNLTADGNPNPNTLHHASPVLKGEKFIITQWFRSHGQLKTNFTTAPYKRLPYFTEKGFLKQKLHPEMYKSILDFYNKQKANSENESSDAIGEFIISERQKTPSKMIELSESLKSRISAFICPSLCEWSNTELLPTFVYGIREYQAGSALAMHTDRIETHVISAIIQVDQTTAQPWPLHIYDHFSKVHRVCLEPGDILFYESARLAHGRPDPFQGEQFANIFVHFAPIAWHQKLNKLHIS